MSSITTKFILYFEDESVVDYVINGFKLHSESDTAPSINYYKPKSQAMADFIKNTSFTFTYFSFEEGKIILGEIYASTAFSPEVFLNTMALLGCSHALLNIYNDQVEETDSLGFLQGKTVKAITAFSELKNISPTIAFKSALISNKSKQACEYIKSGINPDVIIDGKPAIVFATGYGMPQVVKILLESGANPNLKNVNKPNNNSGHIVDQNGNTALHLAVFEEMKATTSLLTKYDANPNIQNVDGSTPLTFSFDSGFDFTDELMKYDCDLNIKNNKGMTPLLVALNSGEIKLKTLKLLVNNGASIHVNCKDGGNALWYVYEQDKIKARNKMIAYLIEKGLTEQCAPIGVYSKSLLDNLILAVKHNDKKMINSKNLKNVTKPFDLANLLNEAIFNKDLALVKYFIDNGANPLTNISESSSFTYTPLMYARECDKNIYKFLKNV